VFGNGAFSSTRGRVCLSEYVGITTTVYTTEFKFCQCEITEKYAINIVIIHVQT
jgi:hypothetical protein